MKIDILLCIDGTSSMQKIIEDVKKNISKFVNGLIKKVSEEKIIKADKVRLKILVFRNVDFDGDNWLKETPFYDLEKSNVELNNFLNNISAEGGDPHNPEEDALLALSNALFKSTWNSSKEDLQVIGIWTDIGSKKINPNHNSLFEGAPSSYEELREFWKNSFLKKHPQARILLFAPDDYPWQNILDEWPNSIHFKSHQAGLEFESPEVFVIKKLLDDLTPNVEEKKIEAKELKQDKEDRSIPESSKISFFTKFGRLWKKYKKIMAISFALLSFSVASFRVISFSLFSFRVEYTKTVNDENTKEFKIKLDELLRLLKEEGELKQDTDVDYSSELETRNRLFSDHYDLILRYSVEQSIDNFQLGQYVINDYKETQTIADIISEHINLVEETYEHHGPIKVNLIGETDGSRIRGWLKYYGEFGNTINKTIQYNQIKYPFKLKKGDFIKSNVQLAVLRAISLWTYVKSKTEIFISKKTELHFEAITNAEFGGEYRKSTIVIRLYDLKNMR